MARILIVNDFAHVEGGASYVAIASAIGLAKRGHQVTYATAVGPVAEELMESDVRVLSTGQHAIANDPSRMRAVAQGLWNRASAHMVDAYFEGAGSERTLVHVHGWTKALSSSVVRASVRRGVPIVCTLNDYFSVCPNGGFFDYPHGEVCVRAPLGAACLTTQCDKQGYGHKVWRVMRQVIQQEWGGIPGAIRHFISVSAFSLAILRPFLPPDAKYYTVPNIIDMPRMAPVPVERHTAYMMVGRLSREKGPGLFAEAAAKSRVEAVFVGDGDERGTVTTLNPAAEITGWCGRRELTDRLRGARVLVFPSLWYEAQPLAVREAAAVGIPAIVSDRCAARDDVEHGVTGLWFRGNDVNDLQRQMSRLRDDATVRAMGQAAYERYWANPATVEHHVDRLDAIYSEIQSVHPGHPLLSQ